MKTLMGPVRNDVYVEMFAKRSGHVDPFLDEMFMPIFFRMHIESMLRTSDGDEFDLESCRYEMVSARDWIGECLHHEISRQLSGNAIHLIELDRRLRMQQIIRMSVWDTIRDGLL